MITTLYFLLLVAFQLWYLTSAKRDQAMQSIYLRNIFRNSRIYRLIALGLILLVTCLFIITLGATSGIFAAIVGLMGVGCLVVLLQPFRYINEKVVAAVYALFVILELFF
jgi:hypothetical protein